MHVNVNVLAPHKQRTKHATKKDIVFTRLLEQITSKNYAWTSKMTND